MLCDSDSGDNRGYSAHLAETQCAMDTAARSGAMRARSRLNVLDIPTLHPALPLRFSLRSASGQAQMVLAQA